MNNGTLEKTGGTGTSTIAFELENSGSLRSLSGTLDFTGGYTQTATGALDVALSGTGAPGIAYGQVSVAGEATLGGALNVSLVNGFAPASGDSFVVMSYASATGAFSSQSLPPLGGGLNWTVSIGPTALTLSVGP